MIRSVKTHSKMVAGLLVALSLGGCVQTIDPNDGPALTNRASIGLTRDGDCVSRLVTVVDEETGEQARVRQHAQFLLAVAAQPLDAVEH